MKYLRRFWGLLLFLLAHAVATADQPAPDLSTPAATLASFRAALQLHDQEALRACVLGVKEDFIIRRIIEERLPGDLLLSTMPLNSRAEVTVRGEEAVLAHQLRLVKEGAQWKIVAPAPPNLPLTNGSLADIAALLSYPETYRPIFVREWEETCRRNLEQLAMAMLRLNEKQGRVFGVKTWHEKLRASGHAHPINPILFVVLMPFLEHATKEIEEIFYCPWDSRGGTSYAFNEKLEGAAQVAKPATTVMVYEGEKGALNFRHDGKAMVAFTDGHVDLVDEVNAAGLRWEP